MDFLVTPIPDLLVVTPKRYSDERGYFIETFKQTSFESLINTKVNFVQDNFSISKKKNTIRGLHYQTPPHDQGKLVRCAQGRLLDVAVDIRKGSPTYGHWYSTELSAENDRQLWIPSGFLHGFRTLDPNTAIAYKCTDYYAPDCDAAIMWNDKKINIDWGSNLENVTISEKDSGAPEFENFKTPFIKRD